MNIRYLNDNLSYSFLSVGANCIPVGWNYKGDLITNDQLHIHLAVDDNSNVYVAHKTMKSLDKWSPQGTLLRRLYQSQFDIESPLFFHSPSQSLYFYHIWHKITDDNGIPESVIENITTKPETSLHLYHCGSLYVNSAGDIFKIGIVSNTVYKWIVNSSSSIVVPNKSQTDSVRVPTTSIANFAIYESDNNIYLLDRRVQGQRRNESSAWEYKTILTVF